MADDGGIGSRGTGERSTITKLSFEVAHNRSLGHRLEGEDISDGNFGYWLGMNAQCD